MALTTTRQFFQWSMAISFGIAGNENGLHWKYTKYPRILYFAGLGGLTLSFGTQTFKICTRIARPLIITGRDAYNKPDLQPYASFIT